MLNRLSLRQPLNFPIVWCIMVYMGAFRLITLGQQPAMAEYQLSCILQSMLTLIQASMNIVLVLDLNMRYYEIISKQEAFRERRHLHVCDI